MKSSGMIRPVDKMGRVVIPKEIRAQLKVENNVDSFEISMDGDKIILKKYYPACIFCGKPNQTVAYLDHMVCRDCIEKLEELKEKAQDW